MSNFNITNIKNFSDNYEFDNLKEITEKYHELVKDFFVIVLENIILQNDVHFLFVIQRGLETLMHCFKMIYMYSKNLNLTLYHCKKAYCYYVEFIGQISDENNSYLQLNSKDATLFVYKKTIFDIDNEYRKTFVLNDDEKKYIQLVTNTIDTHKNIILTILSKEENINKTKKPIIEYSMKKSKKILDKLSVKNKKLDDVNNKIALINYFILCIKELDIDNIKFTQLCDNFVKKNEKKMINIEIMERKINRNNALVKIFELTPIKFINWLFDY